MNDELNKQRLFENIDRCDLSNEKGLQDIVSFVKDYKNYSEKPLDRVLCEKIDRGEILSNDEWESCLDFEKRSERGEHYDDGYYESHKKIIELHGRFFALKWTNGKNDERQQPYEVELKECEDANVVKEWVRIEKPKQELKNQETESNQGFSPNFFQKFISKLTNTFSKPEQQEQNM